jgi:hypothetical protein
MGYLFLFLGVVARLVLPWLVKVYKSAEGEDVSWSWDYLRAQALVMALFVVALPLIAGDMSVIPTMEFQTAFVAGYTMADVSRLINKVTE